MLPAGWDRRLERDKMGWGFRHAIRVAIIAVTVTAGTASIHAQLNPLKPPNPFKPHLCHGVPMLPPCPEEVLGAVAGPLCQGLAKLPSLNDTCNAAFDDAKKKQEEVDGKRRRAWSQIRNATSKMLPTNAKFLVFDFNAQASFSYNVYANTAWYKITTPKGMNIEKEKL